MVDTDDTCRTHAPDLRNHYGRRGEHDGVEGRALRSGVHAAPWWRIIPVNPHAEEILGEPVYRTLADIPEQIGLVDVFRPSAATADVARQAVGGRGGGALAPARHQI